MARRPAEDPDEAPPLTAAELAELRPAREVHTPEEFAALTAGRKRGRPKVAEPKVPVTIRLDASTAGIFRATGRNWQSAVSNLLTRIAHEAPIEPGQPLDLSQYGFPQRVSTPATKPRPARAKARA